MKFKILKIEKATRPPTDFINNPQRFGLGTYRGKYSKPKVMPSFQDTLTRIAKNRKNVCIICRAEATSIVHYSHKGALMIRRYCDICLKKEVDVDKMVIR